jgi:thioredoxin-like negative regulator of GroEL
LVQELSQQQLTVQLTGEHEPLAIFFYTPFCGTCKLAMRMLDVVLELDPALPLVRCNLHFAPQLAADWQISSVPCIVWIKQGRVIHKLYRMRSVEFLLEQLRNLHNERGIANDE